MQILNSFDSRNEQKWRHSQGACKNCDSSWHYLSVTSCTLKIQIPYFPGKTLLFTLNIPKKNLKFGLQIQLRRKAKIDFPAPLPHSLFIFLKMSTQDNFIQTPLPVFKFKPSIFRLSQGFSRNLFGMLIDGQI